MNIKTNAGKVVELPTSPTEWVELTEDPVSDDPITLFEVGNVLVTKHESSEEELSQVEDAGRKVIVTPCYDREHVADVLEEKFGTHLPEGATKRLLDWYDGFSIIAEDDLYSQHTQSTLVEDVVYITLPEHELRDEIRDVARLYDSDSVVSDIAATVQDWWQVDDSDEMMSSATFAGYVKLI